MLPCMAYNHGQYYFQIQAAGDFTRQKESEPVMTNTLNELIPPDMVARPFEASAHLDRLGQEYYVNFYELFEPPFQVTGTDPRFVYLSDQYKKVISICLQVVRDRMGLAMVLGAVGTGKSSICS